MVPEAVDVLLVQILGLLAVDVAIEDVEGEIFFFVDQALENLDHLGVLLELALAREEDQRSWGRLTFPIGRRAKPSTDPLPNSLF